MTQPDLSSLALPDSPPETLESLREARDRYRNQLKNLAALCGMASAKLCEPVSEKDIRTAKSCMESGIHVMRQLLEEEKSLRLLSGSSRGEE